MPGTKDAERSFACGGRGHGERMDQSLGSTHGKSTGLKGGEPSLVWGGAEGPKRSTCELTEDHSRGNLCGSVLRPDKARGIWEPECGPDGRVGRSVPGSEVAGTQEMWLFFFAFLLFFILLVFLSFTPSFLSFSQNIPPLSIQLSVALIFLMRVIIIAKMYARNSIHKANTILPFYGEEAKAQLAQHHK